MRLIDWLLGVFLAVSLTVMVTVVFINVVFRKLFNFSLSWGEEGPLALMCWLTFLGAALAMRDRSHFAFDYLVDNLSGRSRKAIVVSSHVITIAATMALIYWSGVEAIGLRASKLTSLPWVSKTFVYGACPVGSSFLLVYAIRNFLADMRTTASTQDMQERGI